MSKRTMMAATAILAVMTAGAGADPAGLWREKDGGTIRVYSCGAGYCAVIASVNPPLDPVTRKPPTDKNNPDTHKRSRPLVGVAVLSSMRPAGPGKWSGKLYDSDRGQNLSGHLVEIDANTIRIEGCVLGLCGGERLSRVAR